MAEPAGYAAAEADDLSALVSAPVTASCRLSAIGAGCRSLAGCGRGLGRAVQSNGPASSDGSRPCRAVAAVCPAFIHIPAHGACRRAEEPSAVTEPAPRRLSADGRRVCVCHRVCVQGPRPERTSKRCFGVHTGPGVPIGSQDACLTYLLSGWLTK